MFSCLKITFPLSSVISAVRRSQSTWSNGATFASLNARSNRRPLLFFFAARLVVRTGFERGRLSEEGVRPGLSWIMAGWAKVIVNKWRFTHGARQGITCEQPANSYQQDAVDSQQAEHKMKWTAVSGQEFICDIF